MQTTNEQEISGLKILGAALFVFCFLSGAGWAALNWMDEGPNVDHSPVHRTWVNAR